MKIVVLLALVAACSKKPATDDVRAACAAAVERSVELSLAKRRAKAMEGEATSLAPKMKAALSELCVTDAWPADVVTCFRTADDIAACRDKLKPEQRQRFVHESMKVRLGGGSAGSGSGLRGTTIAPLAPSGSGSN